MDLSGAAETFHKQGFLCLDHLYSEAEVARLTEIIDSADQSNPVFRKNKDLFAVRQFLKQVPQVKGVIFNAKLRQMLYQWFGAGYFVTKSIYFDKPGLSNWFVAYHQDLTISVAQRADLPGFGPWTVKQNQFAVQPPVEVLNNNFTLRIHLDNTTADNGALKVLTGSHLQGVRRLDTLNMATEHETICEVSKGGVMLMHPLIFHASDRTLNHSRRRVIHIEFSKAELPVGLSWSEKEVVN